MKIPAIQITLRLEKPLRIPVNYQHLLQSFIYSLLPHQDASYIHENGYQFQNRVYKLFTFSKIQSKHSSYDKRTRQIAFYDKIQISVSSILSEVMQKMANFLLLTEYFDLHNSKMKVESVIFHENTATSDIIIVKALSPVVVYSTYEKRNGSKITHYFSPWDKVFEHLIEENFARKYQAFTKRSLEGENELIKIQPVNITNKNKVVTNYKSTWITGWTGLYELKGKKEYLTFLLNTGLGSKNSSGFGYITPWQTIQDDKEVQDDD